MLDGTRDHARTYHLHRLATALDTEGFHATVKSTYPAALHVFIPGATMLAESIHCTAGTDQGGLAALVLPLVLGRAAGRHRRPGWRGGQGSRGSRGPLTG